MEEIETLCNEYQKLEQLIKPLADKQKEIREAIKTSLQEMGKNEVTVGRVVAKRYATTKVSYPVKLLRQHLTPDVMQKVTQTTVTDTFRITITKE